MQKKGTGFLAACFMGAGLLFCLCGHAGAKALPTVSYVADAYVKTPTVIYAQNLEGTTSVFLPPRGDGLPRDTVVRAQNRDDRIYLFLPSSANLSALTLRFDLPGDALFLAAESAPEKTLAVQTGQPFDLLGLFPNGPEGDGYPLLLSSQGTDAPFAFTLMRSENQGSLYITSDDPETQGREWLESFKSHLSETTGKAALLNADGSVVYDGGLKQLRGRGNTTWGWSTKKPYQIKLSQQTNLLEGPAPEDRDGTWLLLSDAFDATLLHNTVTLRLAQELGLAFTPDFRAVDLYYDGEYRGRYLLTEKVQVAPGRVDILDYGKYIERLYGKKLGVLDTFPTAQAANAYGHTYQYVDGVQAQLREKGAYLVEVDPYNARKEKSWFSTGGGLLYEVHSPAYASMADVDYLSCLFQEIEDTVANHGVHPVTGKTISDYIDLPSVAKYFLTIEYAKICDFWSTSTFFYIPEGANKIYGGPVWDCDIAYAMRDTKPYEGGVDGYVPEKGWFRDLMTLPAFQEEVARCYAEDFEPILQNVLLGDENARGQRLLSLDGYLKRSQASRKMNNILWPLGGNYNNINHDTLYPTYEENVDYFRNYLTGRKEWMTQDIAQWAGHEIQNVWVDVSYQNADITGHASVAVHNPYNNCAITDVAWDAQADPDTPYHTFYTATVTLQANVGSAFADSPALFVNGHPVALLSKDKERCTFAYRFVGPTFAPAVFEDVDYALLYNYDYFLEQNPDVADEVGDDPADVLEYYVSYGMADGLIAIETFDPEVFIANYEKKMEEYYMLDVGMCTTHYLEHCHDENLLGMEAPVYPEPVE